MGKRAGPGAGHGMNLLNAPTFRCQRVDCRAMNSATRKPPARKPRRGKLSNADIDELVKAAHGKPGFRMVREFGELMKLGPYPGFKKLKLR